MQSSSKMKKLSEYDLGESVSEGDNYAGKVEALGQHPTRPDRGYMLVKKDGGEFTIFTCLTDAKSSLCLTRYIPSEVMVGFAKVILGGKAVPSPRVEKKYPVLDDSASTVKPEPEQPAVELDQVMPYFDFV